MNESKETNSGMIVKNRRGSRVYPVVMRNNLGKKVAGDIMMSQMRRINSDLHHL